MAKRVIEHLFTGYTTPYTAYDSTKTVLGGLIGQYTGSEETDKFAGPRKFGRDSTGTIYGIARPFETTGVASCYPMAVRWANKTGYYSTGTVSTDLNGTVVTGSGTSWLDEGVPVNAKIGFGSTNPDSITDWYNINVVTDNTHITVDASPGAAQSGVSYVINKSRRIDWVFMADTATAAATRRIVMYEYDRDACTFGWRGLITMNFPYAGTQGVYTVRGMRAVYQKYTTGTVSSGATTPNGSYYSTGTIAVTANSTTVTGTGTTFVAGHAGMMIGVGSTNPALCTIWGVIATYTSATVIATATALSASAILAGTPYVIVTSYSIGTASASGTAVTGSGTTWSGTGTFTVVNGLIGFGTTQPSDVTTWYRISARGSNTALTLASDAGTVANGAYVIVILAGTVAVSGNTVTGTNTLFSTTTMTGLLIGFGSKLPSGISTWYLINSVASATSMTLATSAGTVTAGADYCIVMGSITGSGTAWETSRIIIGSRIGFGSTDPTQISTWYYINAINSDTSLHIQTNATATGVGGLMAAVSLSAGTAYVIEDLRILQATTNGTTATNAGLFMTTGLSYGDFINAGTTISAATLLDKIKANYWLADAATIQNDVAAGCAVDDFVSWTEQYCYVLEGTGGVNAQVFKYNFRQALTLVNAAATNGKDISTCTLFTGVQAVTGNLSGTNNGRIGTLNHGPGNATKCLYFVSASRAYRAVLTNITQGSSTWWTDSMVEVPPGGTGTYGASGVLTAVEIADQIDRLIITGTGVGRSYVTKYNATSDQMDHVFAADTRQIDQSAADLTSAPHLNQQGAVLTVWSEAGLVYILRTGTAATSNILYAIPMGADWVYATNTIKQRLVTPALDTANATKLIRVYVNNMQYAGEGTLAIQTEPYRLYYRTSGISDDSGSWTLVGQTGNLLSATPSSQIQFAFEFRTIGTFCIPNRIYNLACVYEDNTTDSHYQPSVGQSNLASKIFAWRFSTAFGTTVPTLRIRLFDAVTGSTLLDDTTTASASGTWQKCTDGSTWGAYNATDKANETTYIRYTPTTLGDNIKVRALLTQN